MWDDVVENIIGIDGGLMLLAVYGHSRVVVPTRMMPGHRLAELLGYETAKKLSRAYGGVQVCIGDPFKSERLKIRNRNVVEAYGRGMSVRHLCILFGIAERTVREVLGTPE